MIINIDEELFSEVKRLIKNSNKPVYEELDKIKPLENFDIRNSLEKAREVKTQRIKQSIQDTVKSLYIKNISPTKYQIHKRTGIAYVTINKYYDDILVELKR